MPLVPLMTPLLVSAPFAEPVESNAVAWVTLMVPALVTVQSPELQVTGLVIELLMVVLLHNAACAATGAIAARAPVKARLNTVRRPAVNCG